MTGSEFVHKIVRRTKNILRRTYFRLRDRFFQTYWNPAAEIQLARLVSPECQVSLTEAERCVVRLFLEHRFDLLGAGWVEVRHGMRCNGFEGRRFSMALQRSPPLAALVNNANRRYATRVRSFISKSYVPIDWQLDFKSGFRWAESTWYRDVAYGDVLGADVKVPWELSRMQHLPELGLAYTAKSNEELSREFRDQVLDWIAQNPPRFGVNWSCSMDVGIRVSNWLLAYDLFRAAGARFDGDFDCVFGRSIYDHARHIAQNLEWSESHRANHYLGNVAGLLLASAYLPTSMETDAWLAFSIQELMAETGRQFLSDGGHFEASTSYHRLCAEMVTVCAVILCSVPKNRLESVVESSIGRMPYGPGLQKVQLDRMAENLKRTGCVLSEAFFCQLSQIVTFLHVLMRPDGSIPLIGDDDSGRFVRLGGWVDGGSVAECRARFANLSEFRELPDSGRYFLQSPANHRQLLGWAAELFRNSGMLDLADETPDANVQCIARGFLRSSQAPRLPEKDMSAAAKESKGTFAELLSAATELSTHCVETVHHAPNAGLLDSLQLVARPEFGVYLFRSSRLHLTIRCGSPLRDGVGVHAHDDQLSIDLTIDGIALARDPGSYVYTPDPAFRNKYRSAAAHNGPTVLDGRAQARALFSRPKQVISECLYFGATAFLGSAAYPEYQVHRGVEIHDNFIRITDIYRLRDGFEPASSQSFASALEVSLSPGYGIRMSPK